MNWLTNGGLALALVCLAPIVPRAEETPEEEPPPAANAYASIGERNPFGLKPPPTPAPPPTNAAPATKSELFLTGINAFKPPKRAYLMTKDQHNKVTYYDLTEGVQQDELEVIEINENDRTVRVKYIESEMLLTFATHSLKPQAAPPQAPGAHPGLPGGVPPPLPTPGMQNQPGNPNQPRTWNANPTARPIQSRTLRTMPEAVPAGGYPTRTGNTGAGATPNYGFSAPAQATQPNYGFNNPNQPQPNQPALQPDEQLLLMEAQRAVDPQLPPVPPPPGQSRNPIPPPLPQ